MRSITRATPDHRVAAGGAMEALIVEDSRTERRLISRVLGNSGFNVTETGSAEDAKEKLAAGPPPDLMVVD